MGIEDFVRISEVRLPNAVKAISLLGNLGAKRYGAMAEDKRRILDALYDAVDQVADTFGLPGSAPADAPSQEVKAALPEVASTGVVSDNVMDDVIWGMEMIRRDPDGAREMLCRAIAKHKAGQ